MHGSSQDNLALQFSLELFQVFRPADHRHHRLAGDRTVGSGRPGLGKANDGLELGLLHHGRETSGRPAAAEGSPFFHLDVDQAPLLHLLDRPVARVIDIGRSGEPWTVHVGEIEQRVHHLGIARERLALDAMQDAQIDLLGLHRLKQQPDSQDYRENHQPFPHWSILAHAAGRPNRRAASSPDPLARRGSRPAAPPEAPPPG